ncbi:MAG: uracil phosphoribosyltransferase [Muribaculaceae bacterium]|nr:uracil phosphoribosyltransferase [Muribaculaceae bacterium]MCI6494056.1 uracil phosphoribosyltransferase [Bacteroidales bacterium]MDD6942855.1 uracil phosphoribosyltransferase [Bacteroidales bacterium]MDY2733808.1 uracil phosphoribosyltransferase [Muribaculaceae bacterium]MDY5388071.1 uracil phosphoribosyltransferase [Muribaculaceae bacterium]
MEVINFANTPSLVSRYMLELRSVDIQNDRLRFRTNIDRIGQIMAYEISKRLEYKETEVTTPLGKCICQEPAEQIVLATILRAGLPFHHGFLSYFDHAENAFVSAYRRYKEKGDTFDVLIEYLASPSIEGKTLILVDPMLATGSSMDLAYRALLSKGTPAHIHVASVIASKQSVEYIRQHLPDDTTLWCGAIDDEVNSHSYIVPGLGDAGDLAYGEKE